MPLMISRHGRHDMDMENRKSEDMDDNLDADIYTLVDQDGKEAAFELLDELELDGSKYYAFTPYYENPEENAAQITEDDGDLVILKEQIIDGEETMITIDDDEEYDRIGTIFLDRIGEAFEDLFDDEDEEEE